jgi:hypothetical protein
VYSRFALLLLTILFTSPVAAQTFSTKVPPLRSYFPLNESLAEFLTQRFGVNILPGFYFTDQRAMILSPELHPARFKSQASFDASYLAADEYNQFLYGQNGWKARGTKKLTASADGKLTAERFSEYDVQAGWIATKEGSELWLRRPNGEAWLLYRRTAQGDQLRRALTIQQYLIPVPSGLVAFPRNLVLTRKYLDGRYLSKFPYTNFREELTNIEFTAATFPGSAANARPMPYAVYEPGSQTVIFAGWSSESPHYETERRSSPSSAIPLDLFAFDLKSNTVRLLDRGLNRSIVLTSAGVFFWRERSVFSRSFEVSAEETFMLGALTPYAAKREGDYRLELAGNALRAVEVSSGRVENLGRDGSPVGDPAPAPRLASLSENDHRALARLGLPPDLLNELRNGSRHPLYFHPGVSERLVRTLSKPENPYAVLLYEAGDDPVELFAGFWKSIDMGATATTSRIQEIENVFLFTPALLTYRRREPELAQSLETIRSSIAGKAAQAFFMDFPTDGTSAAVIGGRGIEVQAARLRLFNDRFDPCLDQGACRIVIAMRREVYQSLAALEGQLFSRASVVEIPPIEPQYRYQAARLYSLRHEAVFGRLTESGFATAFADADRAYELQKASAIKRPGFYDEYFLDLLAFASLSAQTREPGQHEISPGLVNEYIAHRNVRWRLEERPWLLAGATRPVSVPLWVKEGSEPLNALTPFEYRIWKDNHDLIKSSSRFSHALVVIPGANAGTEGAKNLTKDGRVELIRPDHDPITALEFVPEQLHPHPDGFYFVYADNREFTLGFYDLAAHERKENPIQILRDHLPSDEYDRGKIRITFEHDRAVIEIDGVPSVYAPKLKEEKK